MKLWECECESVRGWYGETQEFSGWVGGVLG